MQLSFRQCRAFSRSLPEIYFPNAAASPVQITLHQKPDNTASWTHQAEPCNGNNKRANRVSTEAKREEGCREHTKDATTFGSLPSERLLTTGSEYLRCRFGSPSLSNETERGFTVRPHGLIGKLLRPSEQLVDGWLQFWLAENASTILKSPALHVASTTWSKSFNGRILFVLPRI